VHALTDSEKHCEACAQDLRPIGEESSERYEYIPEQLLVIEDHQCPVKYFATFFNRLRLSGLQRFVACRDFNCDWPKTAFLGAGAFQAWCHTHEHVASGVRRVRMLEVLSFCLYRRRTEPQCFVPDPRSFPSYHQRLKPYIFSEDEVARLLRAAWGLKRNPLSPLRPEVVRLATILLFTTGMRRGELLNLMVGDYDSAGIDSPHP
jgi:hypothetical protein